MENKMIIREAYTKTEDFKKSIEIIKNFIKENLGGDIEKFKDFGGIRLEDDILITSEGSRFTGEKRIPITIEEVETIMNE